jgi:hypothetical protein
MLASVGGLGAVFGGPVASASALACESVRIEGPPSLAPRWADAVREAQHALATAADIDCVGIIEVSVSPMTDDAAGDEHVRVSATTVDGRRAQRVVHKPSALAPTIVGLIASIPEDSPAMPRSVEAPVPASTPPPTVAPVNAPPPAASRANFGVWAGLAAGGRIGEPYLLEMLDFEGTADVRVQSWVLCALFRFGLGVAGGDDDASEYSETDIGLGAGRSFPLGTTVLDAIFVPSLATMRFDDHDEVTSPPGSLSELRLGARIRWSIPVSLAWRLTLTGDTEIAPQGFDHPIRTQSRLPALPAWTGGMRIGASGRLL